MTIKRFFNKTLFTALFSFLLISSCFGQNASAATDLSEKLQNIKTLEANFSQTVKDKNGNTLQQSHGKMALLRPGLFRWETQSPNQQLIIADGKTIWIVDKDLDQVTKQKQNDNNNAPGLLLSDSVSRLVTKFRITQEQQEQDNSNIYRLVPKGKKELFQSVLLSFDNNDLKQMTLNDSLGQITEITFSKVRRNTAISPRLFTYG